MKRYLIVILLTVTTILHAAPKPRLQLLYVEMEACPWCHRMNAEIFENPKIASKLAAMYEIKKRYKGAPDLPAFAKPRYYPTTYILSPDGKKVLDELPGYMEPGRFLDYLQELYALENESDNTD